MIIISIIQTMYHFQAQNHLNVCLFYKLCYRVQHLKSKRFFQWFIFCCEDACCSHYMNYYSTIVHIITCLLQSLYVLLQYYSAHYYIPVAVTLYYYSKLVHMIIWIIHRKNNELFYNLNLNRGLSECWYQLRHCWLLISIVDYMIVNTNSGLNNC